MTIIFNFVIQNMGVVPPEDIHPLLKHFCLTGCHGIK